MTLSPHRVGCDVSKAWLDVYLAATAKLVRIANRPGDIGAFVAALPPTAVVVFEATAPYDLALRQAIAERGLRAIRVNPSRARDFARAAGFLAKTDAVDARMLAALPDALDIPDAAAFDPEREALAALHRRRDQLVDARAVERGRIADEPDAFCRRSLERHIRWLDAEIDALENEIAAALETPALAPAVAIVRSIKGVGPVTAATLLALLPELGKRTGKEIAALAGLAPFNRDSGAFRGQRHIGGGRKRVRRALYMAALAAVRCHERFRQAYESIKARSGHAKVALVAIARKLLVILNAMMKSGRPFEA